MDEDLRFLMANKCTKKLKWKLLKRAQIRTDSGLGQRCQVLKRRFSIAGKNEKIVRRADSNWMPPSAKLRKRIKFLLRAGKLCVFHATITSPNGCYQAGE
jgi:hypothetical protein